MKIQILPFSKVIKDITKNFTKIKKEAYLSRGKYKIIDQGKAFICGYTDDEKLVNFDDIPIIIFGDHTKVFKFIDFPLAIGADGIKVLEIDSKIADTKYVYYFLKSIQLHDAGYSRHFKYLKVKKIPLPQTLDEQKKIANLLTQVESLIAKRKESIALLDELVKSSFFDMFGDPILNEKGWEIQPFKYFAKVDTNMTKDFEKYKNYPHIGVANIQKNSGKLIKYKLIKDENLTSGKYLFTSEHIIYSKIRPNLNKVALPNFNGLASADSYPILIDKNRTNRYFFTYVLRSDAFVRFILNFSARANIPKINKTQLENFFSYNPPKPLQDKFATIVKQVEETKEKYQKSLDELHDLFGALSQRAFKGELDL